LRRGDVVVATARGEFGGKPRPYIVVQSDAITGGRVILLGCTTDIASQAGGLRPRLFPTDGNGLTAASDVMVDNPVTARRERVSEVIGLLTGDEMDAVDRALMIVLGLAERR
jgi:mRNA interferase MazF